MLVFFFCGVVSLALLENYTCGRYVIIRFWLRNAGWHIQHILNINTAMHE